MLWLHNAIYLEFVSATLSFVGQLPISHLLELDKCTWSIYVIASIVTSVLIKNMISYRLLSAKVKAHFPFISGYAGIAIARSFVNELNPRSRTGFEVNWRICPNTFPGINADFMSGKGDRIYRSTQKEFRHPQPAFRFRLRITGFLCAGVYIMILWGFYWEVLWVNVTKSLKKWLQAFFKAVPETTTGCCKVLFSGSVPGAFLLIGMEVIKLTTLLGLRQAFGRINYEL